MTKTELSLRDAAVRARDLIGNQSGDITGAALDAWVILSDALRDVDATVTSRPEFHGTHRTYYANDGTKTCAACRSCACHMPESVLAQCSVAEQAEG